MPMELAMLAEQMPREAFSTAKAVAAIAYLVQRTGESLYPVLKMLYLADKTHLEKYGRFIVGDQYVAMAKGPVPSATYDMLKFVRGERQYFEEGQLAKSAFGLDRLTHRFDLLHAPDLDALSESDIECLTEAANACVNRGSRFVRDASHDDAWRATSRNGAMSVEAIAAQFDDGPALVQHLIDRHPS